MRLAHIVAFFLATPLAAAPLSEDVLARMERADIVILGEVHDNPEHHLTQAEAIIALTPSAIVYEMLTPEKASLLSPSTNVTGEELPDLLEWTQSGWPPFELYAPVFTAYPPADVFGGLVTRDAAKVAISEGVVAAFGGDAELYGLTEPLVPEDQAAREAYQAEAHCGELPEEMLPGMVDVQRLRDAVLAREVLTAMERTGGPVVLITGNGHARKDWGVPAYLRLVDPGLRVYTLGQGEGDAPPDGEFDAVTSAAPPQREDPCAVFRQ